MTRFPAASALLIPLLFSGCATAAPGQPGTQNVQSSAPPGGVRTISVGVTTTTPGYGPWDVGATMGGVAATTEIHSNGLVTNATRGGLEGKLAAKLPSLDDGSAVILSDGRVQTTWRLRPNVRWHTGVPLSADDLAFSWEIISHPEVPSGGGGEIRKDIESVQALDSSTLLITWARTYYHFLDLGVRELWPYPRHLLGEAFLGEKLAFQNHPYFTSEYFHVGPFRLVEFGVGETVVYEKFPDYFLGAPKVDRIIVRSIPDSNTLFANLLAGTVDIASERTLPTALAAQIRDEWRQSGQGTIGARQGNWWYLQVQFNPELGKPPELRNDVRVRRGLLYGYDREEVRQLAYPGFPGTESDSFLTGDDPRDPIVGRPFARYPYDASRALQEFADAGARRGPDGRLVNASGQQVQIDIRGDRTVEHVRSFIAGQWRQLGIDAVEEHVPPELINDRQWRRSYPGLDWRAQGRGDQIFPRFDSRLHPSAQNRFTGANVGSYTNHALDVLLDRLYATLDENQQATVLREIGEIMAEDLPALPLYTEVQMVALRQGVRALQEYGGTSMTTGMSRNAHLWERE